MEILNRREVREGDGTEGLVTIYIPGSKGGNGRHEPIAGLALGWPNAHLGNPLGSPPQSGTPPPDVRLWAIPSPPSEIVSRPDSPRGDGSCPFFVGKLLDSLRDGPAAADVYIGADFANFRRARELAAGRGLPLLWANPLKFVRAPERLVLLRALDAKIPYPPEWERLKPTLPVFGPEQEVLALKKFGAGVTDAFKATFAVAEKCAFPFADIVPPLPSDIFPTTLRDEVLARLRAAPDLSWAERERAQRELAVIEKAGFGPYFLVVHDIVEFARRSGILHNLKGSGAGSFLAWLLGISHVNPAAFGLYFERFLNSGRADPPDIDLDFDSRFRDKVLSYVLERYGGGRTGAAFVCSLKNYRARSALYETARAFGLPPDESRALSKKAPYFAEPDYLKTAKPAAGYLDVWKLGQVAEMVLKQDEIDGLITIGLGTAMVKAMFPDVDQETLTGLIKMIDNNLIATYKKFPKPTIIIEPSADVEPESAKMLEAARVPVYTTPERAADVMGVLYRRKLYLDKVGSA